MSTAETSALAEAFDLVDSYSITLRDSASSVVLFSDTRSVSGGSSQHRFDLDLDPGLIGVRVLISVVGFDGSTELYRSSAYTTVRAVTTTTTPVALTVRYTGPGIRGTITDESGLGQGDIGVGLYQSTLLVSSVTTEADGSYLFLDVAPGDYSIEPTPPASLHVCPLDRDIAVQTGDALVADFTTSGAPCQIDLLVLSGGDFDDTQVVAGMFASTQGVTTETFFFVNQTPGLATLRQYDVVLLYANGIFDETTTLGNELAQYIQAGGNVVMGSFYWQDRSGSGFGSPGWGDLESYDPFTTKVNPFTGNGGATYASDVLATRSIVAHPLTLGVNSLTSVAGYSAGVTAKSSTTVVASWSEGDPMIGYRILGAGQRIVAISLFPAATIPTEVTGDVQVLWENAVTWAGIAGGPTP